MRRLMVLMATFGVMGYWTAAGLNVARDRDPRPTATVTAVYEGSVRGAVCRPTGICRVEP